MVLLVVRKAISSSCIPAGSACGAFPVCCFGLQCVFSLGGPRHRRTLKPGRLQTPDTQLEASRSALERKAEVYARLAAGNAGDDDDEDLYNVDFVRKEPARDNPQQSSHAAFEYDYGGGGGGGGGREDGSAREPDSAALLCCSACFAVRLSCSPSCAAIVW